MGRTGRDAVIHGEEQTPDHHADDEMVHPRGRCTGFLLNVVASLFKSKSRLEARSDPSRHPALGLHHTCARPRRTSSPLLQNLIFGTDSGGSVIRPGSPSLI